MTGSHRRQRSPEFWICLFGIGGALIGSAVIIAIQLIWSI